MRRDRLKTTSGRGGFALVTAIFLLVVLAGLGAAVVNISTMQHTSSALDLQGARAYQAARAGIEWGVYRQLIDSSCAAPTSFALPAASFGEFAVTVSCTKYAGATPGLDVYQITSNACNQPSSGNCPGAAGGVDYVERQMRVSF
jgi:MSHA biogenesis protein MshP